MSFTCHCQNSPPDLLSCCTYVIQYTNVPILVRAASQSNRLHFLHSHTSRPFCFLAILQATFVNSFLTSKFLLPFPSVVKNPSQLQSGRPLIAMLAGSSRSPSIAS